MRLLFLIYYIFYINCNLEQSEVSRLSKTLLRNPRSDEIPLKRDHRNGVNNVLSDELDLIEEKNLNFERHRTGNITNAYRYFSFSGTAYCTKKNIMNRNCKHCHVLKDVIIRKVFRGIISSFTFIVAVDDNLKEIVVTFGVSDEKYSDYKTMLVRSVWKEEYYHEENDLNLYIYIDSILNLAKEELSELFYDEKYKTYSLILTGHSRGAAVAMLSAQFFKESFEDYDLNIAIYTFSQSRAAKQYYAKWYDTQFPYYYRIVNGRDNNPHVPGREREFHHAGQEIFIDDYGKVHYCERGEDPNCSNSYFSTRNDIGFFMGGNDIRDSC